jgi:DNA (cytosine-5)-methyltransferase 1
MTEISKLIINKRLSLGLNRREFSELLELNSNGINRVGQWENSYSKPPVKIQEKIFNLKINPPFIFKKTKNTIKFIDLFAGIGGMRLAMQSLGCKCVFSSEIDHFAQKTYAKNFGEIPAGDIKNISVDKIPPHEILLAGFPCQSFSTAGNNLGFQDSRGTLFFEIEKILKNSHPYSFILENVKNLKNHDNGRTFQIILDKLKDADYHVGYTVLNAIDFGCPQNRERIFIVGLSKRMFGDINFQDVFEWPKPTVKKKYLRDILETNLTVDSNLTLSEKMYEGHLKRREFNIKNGKHYGFKIFDSKNDFTGTLSARYFKDGKEILISQSEINKLPRKISPREAARLQGFPDNFIVDAVSISQIHKQFGNSVAVPVIQAVGKSLLNSLKFLKNKKK